MIQSLEKQHTEGHSQQLLRQILTGLALAIAAGSLALALFRAPAYLNFIAEDGPVENGSYLAWLVAALAMARWVWQNRAHHSAMIVGVALLLSFLICGGEEISWGQRIIGFKTPTVLHLLNKQDEMNLHDIGSISLFSNAFFALATLFFLLPLFQNLRSRYRLLRLVHADATRVYVIGLATWIIVGLRFGTLGFSPLSVWGYYTQLDDEIYEFFAAYAFCAFALLIPATENSPAPVELSTHGDRIYGDRI